MEELKKLRLDIDATNQLVKQTVNSGGLDSMRSVKMLNIMNSLDMAKAYTGKLLGELGVETPYKNDGKRTEVKDIEPTDAVASKENKPDDLFDSNGEKMIQFSEKNYVEKVDWLRQLIEKKLIKQVKELDMSNTNREASIYRTQIFVHLTDARLHLGFELGRLRDK